MEISFSQVSKSFCILFSHIKVLSDDFLSKFMNCHHIPEEKFCSLSLDLHVNYCDKISRTYSYTSDFLPS